MTLDRRTLLLSTAGILGAARWGRLPIPRAKAPLRILFLGGTGFIGPHMVQRAIDRGHQVTLFSRGRHGTELFPGVERLIGDRNGQLDALKGKRWDVVIDNSGYTADNVKASGELLAGNVSHYLFTSTLDAYRDYFTAGIDESFPLATLPAGAPQDPGKYYGPLKAMSEREVARIYPNHHTIIRPGWIVGPGDNAHLFTYWVLRVRRGGDILTPGSPDDPMQVIDARDLAAFVIHAAEERLPGAYNAVGPQSNWAEMLHGIKASTSATSRFHWADADFLKANGVKPFFGMPLWWPSRNDYDPGPMPSGLTGGIGIFRVKGDKALAAGMTHRPLADLVRDTADWYAKEFKDWPETGRPGPTPAREAELIKLLGARR